MDSVGPPRSVRRALRDSCDSGGRLRTGDHEPRFGQHRTGRSLLVAAGGYGDFTLYRRLVRQALPFWTHMTAFLLLSLLSTPLALLLPVPLKVVVDSVLG